MLHETGYEKATVTRGVSMADDPQIKRTRKILVIILGVCLALSVFGAISAIFESSSDFEPRSNRRGTQIGESLISILLYSFGLIVAHRYHVMGLRVFAWLGGISLVIGGIVGVVLLVGLIAMLAATSGGGDTKGTITGLSVLLFVIIIVHVVVFILVFVIVRLPFRLAKLIETFKQSNHQQI